MKIAFLTLIVLVFSPVIVFGYFQVKSRLGSQPTDHESASTGITTKRPAIECSSNSPLILASNSLEYHGLAQSGVNSFCHTILSVSLNPSNVMIVRGSSSLVDVTVRVTSTGSPLVRLSAQDVPDGVEISFSPPSARLSFSSGMTISTTEQTPLGRSNVSIFASGGGFAGSAILALLVVPVVHEIAVVSASAPQSAEVGTIVTVNATVANYGSFSETFGIDLYANETLVAEKSPVTLLALANSTASLRWNTTGFAVGKYDIVVAAPPVLGELNLNDNRFEAGQLLLEKTPNSKPAPSPSIPGKEVIAQTYARVLAIAAALAEAVVVFLVFLRGKSFRLGRNKRK